MRDPAPEGNTRSPARLFVYGTLKSQSAHPMAKFLARHARLLFVASCRGCIYNLGEYPGWVPSPRAEDRVSGEVWEIRSAAAEVWAVLDAYEGCDPMSASAGVAPLFRRIRQLVRGPDETEEEVWIYAYCGSVPERSFRRSF